MPTTRFLNGLQCLSPIVIGVTGHRDIPEHAFPLIRKQISEIIHRIRQDYLGLSSNTPIVIMSSLAEGADQIVAQVAITHGCSLIVPLPMDVNEYRKDFIYSEVPNALDQFNHLLSCADNIITMSKPDMISDDDIGADSRFRAEQYRQAGLYINHHSHILLALWDCNDGEIKVGGTADIVLRRSHGNDLDSFDSSRNALDQSDVGPLIIIKVPRAHCLFESNNISTLPWGRDIIAKTATNIHNEQQKKFWLEFENEIKLTHKLNLSIAKLHKTKKGKLAYTNSLKQFLLSTSGSNISSHRQSLNQMRDGLLWASFYASTDALAISNRKSLNTIWIAFFALAFFMAASLGFPLQDSSNKIYIYAIYQLFFVFSISLYFYGLKKEFLESYLDYRVLSEVSRVAFFWKIANILDDPSNQFPFSTTTRIKWIKKTIRVLEVFNLNTCSHNQKLTLEKYNICLNLWIRSQLLYFSIKSSNYNATYRNRFLLSALAMITSTLCTIAIAGADYYQLDWRLGFLKHFSWYIPYVLSLLPAFAAAMQGHSEQMGKRAQALEYDRMMAIYSHAASVLQKDFDIEHNEIYSKLFLEVGKESISETISWTSIFRLRPLKVI